MSFFRDGPIEEIFTYVTGLGYDMVEIAPFTLAGSVAEISTKRWETICRAAEKNGIGAIRCALLLGEV